MTQGNVSFGTLDFGKQVTLSQPIQISGQPNAGAINIQCNKGTVYQILLDGGYSGNPQARLLYSPTTQQTVSYNLYTDATYTTIWDNQQGLSQIADGQEDVIPIYGRIAAQATPLAGNYSDNITVSINW